MRRVLSIDGGGVLGLMAAKFLATHPHLYRGCDLVCGTSTGGLVALALAAGLSPMQIVRLYQDRGPDIFKKSRFLTWPLFRERYSAKPIEGALRDVFGDRRLDEVSEPRLLITAVDYNRSRPEHAMYFFRNESEYTFFDAARATSAAPTYFKPYVLGDRAWVDGGLVANNPADCALVEAIRLWGGKERIHIVSIGCGVQPEEPPTRVTRAPWTYLDDIISVGIGGGVGRVNTLLREVADHLDGVIFDRFDFTLDHSIAMDDASPKVLRYLESRAADDFVTLNGKPLKAAQ